MSVKHTRETRRIQSRLERLELEHLRQHAAELAQLVEKQTEKIGLLNLELTDAELRADCWSQSYHSLAEHLNEGTEDARAIGLTKAGDLLVVRTGCHA